MELLLFCHIIVLVLFLLVLWHSITPLLNRSSAAFRVRWRRWLLAHLAGGVVGLLLGCTGAYVGIGLLYSLLYPSGYSWETSGGSEGFLGALLVLVIAGSIGSVAGIMTAWRIDQQQYNFKSFLAI